MTSVREIGRVHVMESLMSPLTPAPQLPVLPKGLHCAMLFFLLF